jgi:hypothetical protein
MPLLLWSLQNWRHGSGIEPVSAATAFICTFSGCDISHTSCPFCIFAGALIRVYVSAVMAFVCTLFSGRDMSHTRCPFCNFTGSRDPSWGIRDLEDVVKAAEDQGLYLVESIEMPANNLILLFRKRAASP